MGPAGTYPATCATWQVTWTRAACSSVKGRWLNTPFLPKHCLSTSCVVLQLVAWFRLRFVLNCVLFERDAQGQMRCGQDCQARVGGDLSLHWQGTYSPSGTLGPSVSRDPRQTRGCGPALMGPQNSFCSATGARGALATALSQPPRPHLVCHSASCLARSLRASRCFSSSRSFSWLARSGGQAHGVGKDSESTVRLPAYNQRRRGWKEADRRGSAPTPRP